LGKKVLYVHSELKNEKIISNKGFHKESPENIYHHFFDKVEKKL